jgi:hypothetical protein
VSKSIRESTWAVMALESVHLVGLTLLGGPAVVVGIGAVRRKGLRGLSLPTLSSALLPVLWIGLLLMAISGALIAVSMPFKYYMNAAFRWKMVILVLAVTSTVLLARCVARLRADAACSTRQRGLALLVLILWLGTGLAGRFIGFL